MAKYAGPDGQTRYLEARVGSSAPMGAVGDALTVFVQPDHPERAAIKSALPYLLGGILALMGAISCAVFCARFQLDSVSLAGAAVVVGYGAFRLRGSLRDKPPPALAWQQWREKLFSARVFSDASRIAWADPALLAQARRRQDRTNRFGSPILLVAGVGLMLLGIHLHKQTGTFLEKAVRARGTVVGMVRSGTSDSVTSAPIVQFEHEGRRYRFQDSVGSNPPAWRSGDAVDVLYDPSQPADARIDRGGWNRLIPLLVAAFGALLCLAAIVVYRTGVATRR